MIRRPFKQHTVVRSAILGLVVLALAAAALSVQAEEPAMKRPNIFFAIADDWGWPHSPLYGDKVVKTPTFDRIAKAGILFEHAFVSSPSCTPSRNAILTGQYHWRLGSGANLFSTLSEEHRTVTNILEDNGYHVGTHRKAWGPGRDRPRKAAGTPYPNFKEFLAKRPKNKPFFFWAGTSDPHRGYRWQSGLQSGMKLEDVEVPPCFPDNEIVRTDILDYYFEVERFDREVGEQLALLEEIDELNNTIIVMTGDHGWPFPRGKSNLYDLGARVPLAICWGDQIKKGRVVEDFVSFTDFAPTFMEAAGMKPLPIMTGRSLMNVFKSDASGRVDPARDHVLTGKERHTPCQEDHMGGTPCRAIRTGDFLYIHNFEPGWWPAGGPETRHGVPYADIDNSPTKTEVLKTKDDPKLGHIYELSCGKRPADELYDVAKDPHQISNIAADPAYAEVLAKLKGQLMQELKESQDPRIEGRGSEFDKHPYLGRMQKWPKEK